MTIAHVQKSLTKTVLLVALAVGISGCASSFKSDVSAWHQLPQPNGESFVIVAKDDGKAASLEFAHYAEMVSIWLQRIGYVPAQTSQRPDLVVRMDYGMSDARSDVRSTGGIGHIGYGYGPYAWGNGPYGYGYYDGPDIRTVALYARYFEMDIARNGTQGPNLYESKVVSEGRNNRLEEVMPLLIDSMFVEFPGPSGITRRVVLDPEQQAQR